MSNFFNETTNMNRTIKLACYIFVVKDLTIEVFKHFLMTLDERILVIDSLFKRMKLCKVNRELNSRHRIIPAALNLTVKLFIKISTN